MGLLLIRQGAFSDENFMARSHKQMARARLNLKQTSYNHNTFRNKERFMISKPIDIKMFNLHII
jgi:hypothetical protein